LLNEARYRLNILGSLLTPGYPMPTEPLIESSYLQVRMLCEVIALGCLLMHGDIEETRSRNLETSYKADFILKKLSSFHSDFFPKPVDVIRITDGNGEHDIFEPRRVEDGFLGRDDLIKLYQQCGSYLHRGNLERINENPGASSKAELARLHDWSMKIGRLLTVHEIASRDLQTMMLCFLRNPEDPSNSVVVTARQIPPRALPD
jgi:hypothetical protein